MSNEAITAVAKSDIRPSGRKFVAMALADYADEAWSCFPSVEQLALYTCQGEKTVRDHLAALEEAGVISRERQRRDDGTLGRYRFRIQRRNLPVAIQRQVSPVADFARGEKHPEPAADFAAHNPQLEPSSIPSKRELTQFEELSKVLDADHARAVIAHRKNFKAKFSPYAASLLAKEFALCPDPNAAADEMIKNGWQGFEAQWLQKRQRGSPTPKASSSSALADSASRLVQSLRSANEVRSGSSGTGLPKLIPHLPVR